MDKKERTTFYFVRATQDGPEVYSHEAVWDKALQAWSFGEDIDFWGCEISWMQEKDASGLYTDIPAAKDFFKRISLAEIAHYRTKAHLLMDNLKKLKEIGYEKEKER